MAATHIRGVVSFTRYQTMTEPQPLAVQSVAMPCPCCGQMRARQTDGALADCLACGARQVGPPLTPPDIMLPRLGLPFAAVACLLLSAVAFLALWIFGNDAKVGRALLVWALGDGTKLTRELLAVDPKLPAYRIFAYDAYKAAFTLSFGLAPLSLLGMWLARKARRMALLDASKFGGLKTARASFALSLCLFVLFATVLTASIPGMLERGRMRRAAATRALMYELHAQALDKYYREYGTYPQQLEDLTRVRAEQVGRVDYWEHKFIYAPQGVIASRGSAISLSDYKLVSPGPDGKLGTADDITMVNGVIVENQADADLMALP